ncbi:MAG: DNA helicase UvrD [Candidatus Magasanikbacteria bacterium]|nr:DNA helicase UvrD [Candidatus Magasanikbacteria bacterium]
MLEQILDLHIHSKYSRACSPALELPNIARACRQKGIDIVSAGDFTHPLWFKHLAENLAEENEGVYVLRSEIGDQKSKVRFILSTEISCIYSHGGKTRRIHLLIFAPALAAAQKFNQALEKRGVNLKADGRPIMGLSAKEIVQICLAIDERMMVVPAHAWTPWFSVFGSKSGYDSLAECFEEFVPQIHAIETGLSSDPPMNRRLSALDNITLISNSDAHSLDNLGREANVFAFTDYPDITYDRITRIIKTGNRQKFLYTIEFFPEEGKYHYDGHKDCQVVLSPAESKREGGRCPKCKRPLTIGVLNRVEELADRAAEEIPAGRFIPHRSLVPLREIIAAAFSVGVASKQVAVEYQRLVKALGSEFAILLHRSAAEINQMASTPAIAAGIERVRAGRVTARPGYDGVFGVVDVLGATRPPAPRQAALL